MSQRRRNLLAIDDNPANLHLLTLMLSDHGYAVHAASNGVAILRFLQEAVPDLILFDISGGATWTAAKCANTRRRDPRTRDMPIIFVSVCDEAVTRVTE